MTATDPNALRKSLEAIPPKQRLDYLAGLPADELVAYKRILSAEDRAKLNQHVDRLERAKRTPTVESWLADARAGRAATPEAMVEVLKEVLEKLRPNDADWIRRIDATSGAVGYSRKQRAVIEGIYARYFRPSDS